MTRRYVLSGCSGGGKSSLLAELSRRGYETFDEPGRDIVRAALAGDGGGLPWDDPVGFARRAIDLSVDRFHAARTDLAFYDRSFLDAVIWFERSATPIPADLLAAIQGLRYEPMVFLVPPWAKIFEADAERRHTFKDAVAEFDALLDRLPNHGYHPVMVPKGPIAARADWVLAQIDG